MMSLITAEIMDVIRLEYALDWEGRHGIRHWQRVKENGFRLAEINGADTDIIELFAFLHDVKRENDGWDIEHGLRAALFLQENRQILPGLHDVRFDQLIEAVTLHSTGATEGDITIQTCWDADRLDLGRIGVRPDPQYLCTEAAQNPEIIQWAYQRSRAS